MSGESKMEKKAVAERAHDSGPHGRMTAQPSVKSELPEGMKTPAAPGEQHMGGTHKGGMRADMGRATRHLEHQTERGAHTAEVGGHKLHHR